MAKHIPCNPILVLSFLLLGLTGYWIQPVSCRLTGDMQNDQKASRQLLSLLADYDDPKSVVQKTSSSETRQWKYPMDSANLPRPIDILALGGSVTWGATLDNQRDAYPWLIGSPNVDHVDILVTPGMGAYYSAICLESLIPDSAVKNYDVILLGFAATELQGFEWLLNRLRERYPEAIIIFVHFWPLKLVIQNSDGLQPDILGLDSGIDWGWIDKISSINKIYSKMSEDMREAAINAGGNFYHLKFLGSPKDAMEWFSDDWWHLSAEGHKMVANGMLELLSSMNQDIFKTKRLGSFGAGDHCYNSFVDENIAAMTTTTLPQNSKSASFLKIDQEKHATIRFHNPFSTSVPLVLAYISNNGHNIDNTLRHSSVDVSVVDYQQPTVRINPNHFYLPEYLPKVKYVYIGGAHAGGNVVQFNIVDPQNEPFRLVGLFLNGDIANLQKLGTQEFVDQNQSFGRHIISCMMRPDDRVSVFSVNYDIVDFVLSETADRLYPDWNVHLITSGDEAVQRFSSLPNVNVVDYSHAPLSHRLETFKKAYIHQSINDIEYEKFCLYRWIIIYEYALYLQMRGVSVEHLLTIDTDLLVLDDPFLVDNAVDWHSIESYRIIDGGAIIWSLEGLQRYVEFIMDLYTSKEKAKELINKIGFQTKECHENKALLIPCFKQDEKMVMWHVSDFLWYNIWIQENSELRIKKSEFDCAVIPAFRKEQQYNFTHKGSHILVNSQKVCCVHFQGRTAKMYAIPFHLFLHGETSIWNLQF